MTNDESRKEFEEWYGPNPPVQDNASWQAWQAGYKAAIALLDKMGVGKGTKE